MGAYRTLNYADEKALRDLLVGRRIVAAERGDFPSPAPWSSPCTGRLTLDDGTQVLVAPNEGGCVCSAGDYALTHLASVDNVITSVRVEDEKPVPDYEDAHAYRIYVIADAVEINALSVEGDDGSGYYGTGYELFVLAPHAMSDEVAS